MILGHKTLIESVQNGDIVCNPFDPAMVGSNSIDLHLGNTFLIIKPNEYKMYNGGNRFVKNTTPYIDPKKPQTYEKMEFNDGFILAPGDLILGTTVEKIGSTKFVPMLEGRSSIGRMGLFVHVTAGFGDVGFIDNWTLELTCVKPIHIYTGMRIAQVFFHTMTDNSVQYNGRYVGQDEPKESLFYKG